MGLSQTNFEYVYKYIIQCHRPEDLFGDLGNGDVKSKLDAINRVFREQCPNIHPDLYSDKRMKYMAEEAFKAFNEAKSGAEEMVKNGTYGKSSTSKTATATTTEVFKVGDFTYMVSNQVVTGDFCQVFMARREGPNGTEDVCLKIPLDICDNDLMENEANTYRIVQHKSLPSLVDTFFMQNKQVNVLRQIVGGFDLVSIMSYFPNGLPQEHVVWIIDRLLSVLGFLHINNIIHGSIEPGNIMIVPGNHNSLLLDMLLSVPSANLPGAIYHGINQYTAPEIISKTHLTPHPSSDMYSLGKSMQFLLGGDINSRIFPVGVDPRIKSFLGKFLDPDPQRRANDAWQSWHQLRQLRTQVFGVDSHFIPLIIG